MTEPAGATARRGVMHWVVAALVLALIVSGCGSPAPSATTPAGDPEGSWRLTSGRMDDHPIAIVDDHPITITIEGSRIGGRAACNEYGGRIAVTAGGIEIRDVASTAMACLDEAAMDAEAAYVNALQHTTAIAVEDGELVLGSRFSELRFARLAPPPTAQLIDTVWVLETLFVGDVASSPAGAEATLELRGDGTFSGSTGCRTFDGAWVERGDQVLALEMGMNEVECPAEMGGQDSHVVAVIGDGFVASVESELLTLVDPGGVGLIYRKA